MVPTDVCMASSQAHHSVHASRERSEYFKAGTFPYDDNMQCTGLYAEYPHLELCRASADAQGHDIVRTLLDPSHNVPNKRCIAAKQTFSIPPQK